MKCFQVGHDSRSYILHMLHYLKKLRTQARETLLVTWSLALSAMPSVKTTPGEVLVEGVGVGGGPLLFLSM